MYTVAMLEALLEITLLDQNCAYAALRSNDGENSINKIKCTREGIKASYIVAYYTTFLCNICSSSSTSVDGRSFTEFGPKLSTPLSSGASCQFLPSVG